jgi:TPP-dependent 2-oxoacid decarboxylase
MEAGVDQVFGVPGDYTLTLLDYLAADWDWTAAPALFGAGRVSVARRVTTAGELDQALAAADSPGELALIQAVVPRMDIPPLLESLAHAASTANAPRPASAPPPPTTAGSWRP